MGEQAQEVMTWDADARNAIDRALESAEWSNATGEVTVDTGDVTADGKDSVKIVAKNREELEHALWEIGSNAWSGSVPFDGGSPVFEFDDDLPMERLERPEYQHRMRLLGWEL